VLISKAISVINLWFQVSRLCYSLFRVRYWSHKGRLHKFNGRTNIDSAVIYYSLPQVGGSQITLTYLTPNDLKCA